MSRDFLRESMAVPVPVPAWTRAQISYADFLEPVGESKHVERFDGKVLEMSPVTDWRADINDFLYSLPDSLTRRELMLPQS